VALWAVFGVYQFNIDVVFFQSDLEWKSQAMTGSVSSLQSSCSCGEIHYAGLLVVECSTSLKADFIALH